MSAADSGNPDANLPVPKTQSAAGPSTPQRDAVIDRLTRSFAEDAITMDEFERRAELVYRAVSTAELQVLVSDLPAPPEPLDGASGKKKTLTRVSEGDRITTVFGSTERRMPGPMPRYLRLRTLFGNTELDFRNSTFEPGVTEVNVRCMFGNVELTVPDGVRVEILCSAMLANVGSTGLFDDGDHEPLPSTMAAISTGEASGAVATTGAGATPQRILRITGRALFANVEIHKGALRREP